MVKLKEIHRTSTFAWSPSPELPLLATGTVAGALDESFSNNGQLEIWAPDFLNKNEYDLGVEGQAGPKASITTTSRFNRLAWGFTDGGRDRGVLVAGMENGELDIWDPSHIVASADPTKSLILRNKTHTGPVRGLDFNPIQTNLFASGAVNGEIYIWDLKDPSKPYSPGTRSTKLDEITSLAWNHHVQYALAASSSTGYTVVWDLRGKREVAALAYGGGAGTQAGMQAFSAAGLAVGGRRGMSDVAWHPDNATRLVTSSEDDTSPVIMVWDLRNARAPEKILTGHEKGVLSLSWCKQDADLLLSCGKDNRALCWNPQTSEIIGELPSAENWAFQVDWCPRNPDLFATAFFDGTIGIHSIQSTNEPETPTAAPALKDASDVFDQPGFSRAGTATLSLKQPPKWLRRPVSGSFGYGGKLVTVSNLPGPQGKHQSEVVHFRTVVTEPTIAERAAKLQKAIQSEALHTLAQERSESADETSAGWKALLSLFRANSRDELITLLGFSKGEVAARVAEAVARLKVAGDNVATSPTELDVTESTFAREPVVSFAEPERDETPPESPVLGQEHEDDTLEGSGIAAETTPSEVSASATSDTTRLADGESTTTAPSLFGDEIVGTPQMDAAADFFGSIGVARSDDTQPEIPHHNYPLDSSVAATIGSRPSSVTSESLKNNTFRIYPNDESETDRLVTKALVLGDFESAVSLCLSTERFADAILLAVRGGPELLQRTQKAYFERRTAQLPYLRVFQSVVTNDLDDIVQNADLQEWQEIFVVLCTFAGQEDFSSLAEQLGQRLEFQASLAKASVTADAEEKARVFRKHATLTYLAAARLERLVNIWTEELAEEEASLLAEQNELHGSRYTAHAHALQTFVEKVTTFRGAVDYKDIDLAQPTSVGTVEARTYKLSGLYDRYFEYADLLAAQGLVKEAVAFLKLTPTDYHGAPGSRLDFSEGRKRLQIAAGLRVAEGSTSAIPGPSTVPAKAVPVTATSNNYGYGTYTAPTQPFAPQVPASAPAPTQHAYGPYGAPTYGSTAAMYTPAGIAQPSYQTTASIPQNTYPTGPYGQPAAPQSNVPLPPPPRGATPSAALLPPPKAGQIKRDNGGWNDAPASTNAAQRRTPSQVGAKLTAITSPFPNAPVPMAPPTPPIHGQAPNLPPPPRPGSVQQRGPPQNLPPPPRHGIPPTQVAASQYPQHMRPPTGPPGSQSMPPPPGSIMSPPQGPGVPQGPPPTGPYPPPPQRGHLPQSPPGPTGQIPPGPGPFRGTPSPNYARATSPPGQTGPYAPPLQQGGFVPPPQPGQFMQPPPQGVPRPGPPGTGTPVAPPPGSAPATAPAPAPPKAKPAPPPPKYSPGDRSHIPDNMKPVYNVISEQLDFVRQTTPPQQKRMVEDLERRLNILFDALNCETLSPPVCEQLTGLTQAMATRDRETALALHIDLLRTGSVTDEIGMWMTAVKQLILRL